MRIWLTAMLFAMAAAAPPAAAESAAGHITGIGGVFVRSPNPKALRAWYRDVLGISLEPWGGAVLRTDAPHYPAKVAWAAFSQKSDYMAPSSREFMVDFAVDDLNAMVAKIAAKGVKILGRSDDKQTGKFAWILDPDGTKIELWQPVGP